MHAAQNIHTYAAVFVLEPEGNQPLAVEEKKYTYNGHNRLSRRRGS